MALRGRASISVDAPPDRVFATLTDLAGLPSWTPRITGLVELPARLGPGAEWVVASTVAGVTYTVRSSVIELDRAARRFVYRSKREVSDPSFTIWTWKVDSGARAGGATVTVEWEQRPATLVAKRVVAPLRNRRIEGAGVPATLAALARACARPGRAPASPSSSSSGEG